MGRKKRFGLDIDGTVTCPSSFLPYLNEAFSTDLSVEDITQYDLSSLLGISEEAFWTWMMENEKKIYAKAKKAQDVDTVLTNWKNDHELLYISARGEDLLEVTKNWFDEHALPYHHIECIGHHDKVNAVKKHQLDIFFEDKHDNACNIAEECNIPVILMDTPYNRLPVPDNVIRVHSWREAKHWVEEHWLKAWS